MAQYRVWQLLPANAGTAELRAGLAPSDSDWLEEEGEPVQYLTSWRYSGYVTDDDLEEDRPLDEQEDDTWAANRLAEYRASWGDRITTGRSLKKMRFVDTLSWKRDNAGQDQSPPSVTGKVTVVKRKVNAGKAVPRKRVKKSVVGPADDGDADYEDDSLYP